MKRYIKRLLSSLLKIEKKVVSGSATPSPTQPPLIPWPHPSNDIPSVAHLYGNFPEEGEEPPTHILPSKAPDFNYPGNPPF